MPTILIDPRNETTKKQKPAAPRLDSLKGKTVALLDISKPGGNIFLDQLESLLQEKAAVNQVVRMSKPTFTKPAPDAVIESILQDQCDAVIEALAD